MVQKLIYILGGLRRFFLGFPLRRKIKNKFFTIISNNCWGSELYQELRIPYQTPFVGLFIKPESYLKLLKNLKKYLNSEIKFTKTLPYPVGVLGEDVEIHFLHYKTTQEALEKWQRRVKRIHWDRLLVKFDDLEIENHVEWIHEFGRLPFQSKVCFVTQSSRAEIQGTFYLQGATKWPYAPSGGQLYRISRREFDLAKWVQSN